MELVRKHSEQMPGCQLAMFSIEHPLYRYLHFRTLTCWFSTLVYHILTLGLLLYNHCNITLVIGLGKSHWAWDGRKDRVSRKSLVQALSSWLLFAFDSACFISLLRLEPSGSHNFLSSCYSLKSNARESELSGLPRNEYSEWCLILAP